MKLNEGIASWFRQVLKALLKAVEDMECFGWCHVRGRMGSIDVLRVGKLIAPSLQRSVECWARPGSFRLYGLRGRRATYLGR